MEALKIVFVTIIAAIVYGILHDQVTARVCVEYFTIGHPRIIESNTPTALAMAWGVVATWWAGAIIGVSLACCAQAGRGPMLTWRELHWPLLVLMGAMAVLSLVSGLIGYALAQSGSVWLLEPLASRVPKGKHHVFLANLWAHSAAYVFGFLGGILLCAHCVYRRWCLARNEEPRLR